MYDKHNTITSIAVFKSSLTFVQVTDHFYWLSPQMASHRLGSHVCTTRPYDGTRLKYQCQYPGCHLSFNILSSLNRHQRDKHKKPRNMPFIPRRSSKLANKPHMCNYPGCNRSYFTSSGLIAHKRQKHDAIYAEMTEPIGPVHAGLT